MNDRIKYERWMHDIAVACDKVKNDIPRVHVHRMYYDKQDDITRVQIHGENYDGNIVGFVMVIPVPGDITNLIGPKLTEAIHKATKDILNDDKKIQEEGTAKASKENEE